MRTATPKSARLAALVAANWTCQAPGCGRTAAHLARLRDRLLALAKRKPKALMGTDYAPGLLRRYKIVPDSTLLEVDHIVEQADGGGHEVENLQVLCVICHQEKTVVRVGKRARAPRKVLFRIENRALCELQETQPRRRVSEAEFQAAIARKQKAAEEWVWGC